MHTPDGLLIRDESPEDAEAIREVTEAAFELNPYSDGSEPAIIDALRNAGALSISMVAVVGDDLVGHIAFSPVTIDGRDLGWFGGGPLSVTPTFHGRGIGSALVRSGLARLEEIGAAGCVLVGDTDYYRRFGFERSSTLRYPAADDHFMALTLREPTPSGEVAFHPAFGDG